MASLLGSGFFFSQRLFLYLILPLELFQYSERISGQLLKLTFSATKRQLVPSRWSTFLTGSTLRILKSYAAACPHLSSCKSTCVSTLTGLSGDEGERHSFEQHTHTTAGSCFKKKIPLRTTVFTLTAHFSFIAKPLSELMPETLMAPEGCLFAQEKEPFDVPAPRAIYGLSSSCK